MALIKRICPACKGGRGFEESWTGRIVACLHCRGTGTVMAPDDAEARRMIAAAMESKVR